MMNQPTIKVILSGDYYNPHVVIQIGNQKTAAHTEQYSNRSNGRRSWNTWFNILSRLEHTGTRVLQEDKTVKPT